MYIRIYIYIYIYMYIYMYIMFMRTGPCGGRGRPRLSKP